MAGETEKMEDKKDDSRNDASEKLDKLLTCIDSIGEAVGSLSRRMDAYEEERMDKKGRKDDDAKKKDDADEDPTEETQAKEVVADKKRRDDAKKKDDAAKKKDDAAKKKDDDGELEIRHASEGNVEDDAKKRRDDDDDDDDRKDARRKDDDDARKDSNSDIRKQLAHLQRMMPRVMTDEDYKAQADAQARADSVYSLYGRSAPRPMPGEHLPDYRRRLVVELKQYSSNWKDVELSALDDKTFPIAEKQIYNDAEVVGRNPPDLVGDTLRAVTRIDDTGRKITEFVGSPRVLFNPMAARRQYFKGLVEQKH